MSIDIEIRRAEPDDYRGLQSIHAQPGVIRGTLQLPLPSAQLWKQRLADAPESMHNLVALVDGEIVGAASLWQESRSARRRHAAGLGIVVHDGWRRRGVGAALMESLLDLADNWLNLVRVELNVFTDNDAAISLYRRYGFEVEGTMKRYAFRDGRFVDAHVMARIRPPATLPR